MWRLTDALSGEIYERDGSEMVGPGLYVELGPWGSHFFQLRAGEAGSDPEARSS